MINEEPPKVKPIRMPWGCWIPILAGLYLAWEAFKHFFK
jgi:hypothetical protein